MATPSEVPLMKECHWCQVSKPITEFSVAASGKRAGIVACVCTKCSTKHRVYPAHICIVCGQTRGLSDFDRTAEAGKVCKSCLTASPEAYQKVCAQCGTPKPLSDYHNQTKTAYRISVCKRCTNDRTMAKQRSNPEAWRASRRRHTQRIKAEVFQAYGGAKCACCEEAELTFLTLDHINNDGAAWRRANFGGNQGKGAGTATYEWCKRNGYPPIFQVLCWNCQQGKRFNGGICPHQKETCNDYPAREYGQAAGSASGPQ